MTRRSTLALAWGAVLAVAVVVSIQWRSEPAAAGDPPAVAGEEAPVTRRPERRTPSPAVARTPAESPAVAGLPAPQSPPDAADSGEHEEWVETRSDELLDLAWNEDRESMLVILSELRSPVPEIRRVAADATREFGSRDAIPVLRALVEADATPEESETWLELIEWLELPTLREHMAAERQRGAAEPAE